MRSRSCTAGIAAAAGAGVHWRAAPAFFAFLYACQSGPRWITRGGLSEAGLDGVGGVRAAACGVAAIVGGVVLVLASFPAARLWASLRGDGAEPAPVPGGPDPYGFDDAAGGGR
jgi:hypothetical protein